MARYADAVRWIAENDETAETEAEEMETLISVLLVADVWSKPVETVARDVIRLRLKNDWS